MRLFLKSRLLEASYELNCVLKPVPEISIDLKDISLLKKSIIEASKLVNKNDKLSVKTRNIITILKKGDTVFIDNPLESYVPFVGWKRGSLRNMCFDFIVRAWPDGITHDELHKKLKGKTKSKNILKTIKNTFSEAVRRKLAVKIAKRYFLIRDSIPDQYLHEDLE